jgi:hypothetical protein
MLYSMPPSVTTLRSNSQFWQKEPLVAGGQWQAWGFTQWPPYRQGGSHTAETKTRWSVAWETRQASDYNNMAHTHTHTYTALTWGDFVCPEFVAFMNTSYLCYLNMRHEHQLLTLPQHASWTPATYATSTCVMNTSYLCYLNMRHEHQLLMLPQHASWTPATYATSTCIMNTSYLCYLNMHHEHQLLMLPQPASLQFASGDGHNLTTS